jgi:flagellar hook-associated protein 2
MSGISTGIGLISGINSKDIIEQLMSLEARPKTTLQARIASTNQQKLAYTDISTRLATLKLAGTTLKKPSTFQNAAATSGNDDVLTASTSVNPALGSFQFQVARLVTSQQGITNGFADTSTAKVGAGTLTVEMGGGDLSSQTLLSQLNGGTGIRRGAFRITDRSGKTALIDTSAAVSLDDVVKKINTSLDITVRATINGDSIKLTDLTGSTASNFIVQDLGEGHSAADLGIIANAASNTITGTDVNYLGPLTALSHLNDGRGVRTASTGADFRITARNGSTFDITVGTSRTIGDIVAAINTAAGSSVTASIAAGSNGITLTDNTGGGGSFTVTALNGSKAALDLGIEKTGAGATITGDMIVSNLNTVLLASLRGGTGLPLGTVSIQDRAGASANIDLTGARTVQDVLDTISNAGGVNVTARLNASGNGIQITDDSAGAGNIVIADVAPAAPGGTATALGIAGTFDTTFTAVKGANLQKQWISENSLLESYNGGRGVAPGIFKITNSNGLSAEIDLTEGNETKLGEIINLINAKGIGVTASINANGDGLLLTDTAGGGLKLKVEDTEGSAADDLGIAGEATATTLDGTFEKTITVGAADTLEDVQKKINDLSFGLAASIINDGSGLTPYRLSLSSRNAGRAGRVVFDAGSTLLETRNLVESQDAAVFLGGTATDQPLLITSGKNQLSNVIRGVNIDLHSVSDKPVSLNVSRSVDNVVDQIKTFATGFNDLVGKLQELTDYNPETNARGLLLGEIAAQKIETQLYAAISGVIDGAGRYRTLSEIGLRLGEGAQLEFDEEKFKAAYATDPESVSGLFTLAEKGAATIIEQKLTKLIDPVSGIITRENDTLDLKTREFENRIESLDKTLEAKRTRLERQFAQLEGVLAGLQNQQQAIGSIQTIQPIRSAA